MHSIIYKKHQTIYYSGHSKNAPMFTGSITTRLPELSLPKAALRPYNYTQRYAARLACNKTKKDSAGDCMKMLHWLPIEFRTKFKLLTIVFKTLQGNGPSYLQTKLNTITYWRTTRRSTAKGITLKAPFNKQKTYGDRGFTYTAASHWNMLPEYIRQTGDISTFKRVLKTHYFKLAYST